MSKRSNVIRVSDEEQALLEMLRGMDARQKSFINVWLESSIVNQKKHNDQMSEINMADFIGNDILETLIKVSDKFREI